MEFDKSLLEKVSSLPTVPGIYKFLNSSQEIIYIGKAKNLKSRVKSYFNVKIEDSTKTAKLVESIKDVEYVEVFSEIEALILEAELIRAYRPRYNIALKDDKSYLYIVIRDKLLPKVFAARETDLLPGDRVFGPYPEGRIARSVIKNLRRALPYRDCSDNKFKRYKNLQRPCLFGQIGLCQAPCTGTISIKDYNKEIKRLSDVLSGKTAGVLKELEKKMVAASKSEDFELAAKCRDQLRNLEYVRQNFKSAQRYIQNPNLVEDIMRKSLEDLVESIPVLRRLPSRIECYDISNISGKFSVGSMVVALNGRIANSEYRMFRIRSKNSPDDFVMMKEVIARRFKNNWSHPDLLVVDGGKGQVSSVKQALEAAGVDIPVIGIAKRFETLVYMEGESFIEIVLPRDNEGLKLIQRLRDESHRFAQYYHHKLRLRGLVETK